MKWTTGVVENKRVWAPGLFTLSIAAAEVAPFKPGQFLQLGRMESTGRLNRPYSVASPYGAVLDFFIVLVENGRLTPYLWDLQPGDPVDVSVRAAGSFTLEKCPPATSIWLLSTGTGIAPYIAMLRDVEIWQRYEQIFLVHGVRQSSDLAYREEIGQYQQRVGDRLKYLPVVSREVVSDSLSGRITTCLLDGSLESRAGAVIDTNSCIMMCGNPDMLDQTEQILASRGLQRHRSKSPGQIVVERYW